MTLTPGDSEPVDPGQDPTRGWRPSPPAPATRTVPVAPPNWLPNRVPARAPGNPAGKGVAAAMTRPDPGAPGSTLANPVLPGTAGGDGRSAPNAGGPTERPARAPLPPELSPRGPKIARPPVDPADDIMAPTEVRAPGRQGRASTGPRRARLVLRRLDPWSVLKFTLVASICGVIVGVLVITALYEVVSGLGVFDSVAKFLDTITDAQAGSSTRSDFTAHVIIGGGAVLLAVGALLFTALATLGAFIYNLCATLTGGLEVTLSERT